jgi:hypothetical protein
LQRLKTRKRSTRAEAMRQGLQIKRRCEVMQRRTSHQQGRA